MALHEIVASLDIGTTKVVCLVGRKNEQGKIEILGIGKSRSEGIHRGVVANVQKTVESIRAAVREAGDSAGVDIGTVNVGIAGQHIRSKQHRGMKMRESLEEMVRQEDIDMLIDDTYRLVMPPGEEIIHVLPQEYIMDKEQGIRNPIGMTGIRLEANFHIISGQVSAVRNINKCIHRAGLSITELILEPLASSMAVLSQQEKDAGVVLVDIGGGTTDIAIYFDNIIRHTAIIPFGGNVITEDIRQGCGIMRDQAELLKTKFASALAAETKADAVVSIPGLHGREPQEISLRSLAEITQSRMEEILELVYFEIKKCGIEKQIGSGLVLTGGGAQLGHVCQLAENMTGMPTRIGYPNECLAKNNVATLANPLFATGVGLVIMGFNYLERQSSSRTVAQHARVKGHSSLARVGNFFDRVLKGSTELLKGDDEERADSWPPQVKGGSGAKGHDNNELSTNRPNDLALCHFKAETEANVVVGSTTVLTVSLGQKEFDELIQGAGSIAEGFVNPAGPIFIHVIPKRNVFLCEGSADQAKLGFPRSQVPIVHQFKFIGNQAGEGELWVVARQHDEVVATLEVKFTIVAISTATSDLRSVASRVLDRPVLLGSPVDRLSIYECRDANGLSYCYDFHAPSIGQSVFKRSIPFKQDREEFITRLYSTVEGLVRRTDDLYTEDLQVLGTELLEQLMPIELQHVLWENRKAIRCIHVFSEEPFIPWELLHLKPPNSAIQSAMDGSRQTWFLGQLGLVRWLHNTPLPPTEVLLRKNRTFTLIPKYSIKDHQLPEAQKEATFLNEKFGTRAISCSLADVRNLFRGPGAFDLLHFAGHGNGGHSTIGSSMLLLSSDSVNGVFSHTVEARTIAQTAELMDANGNRPMVVLNACRAGRSGWQLTQIGGFAAAFITRGAGVFVGGLWNLGDAPARVFTECLYSELLKGKTLSEASQEARAAIRGMGDATWLAYTIYGHPNATLAMAIVQPE